MVTLKQIAEHCGVSVSTVSKALNGAMDVSRETTESVRLVAEEMGYMPNAAARALKTNRSYSFGLLIAETVDESIHHEFFSHIISGFKHRSERLGYDVAYIGNRLGKRSISYAEHVRYRNCDGVLVVAAGDGDEAVLRELSDAGIPVVSIDYCYPGCGSIVSDNRQGMRDLVEHIIRLGHRRIAFVHGQNTLVTRRRMETFLTVCAEHGIDVPEEYVTEALYHDSALSQEATRRLLSLPEPPTCILYPDDLACIGGRNELEQRGLSIPGDMSIAGYDGVSVCQIFHPRLTTVRQDADTLGDSAARELARLVEAGGGAEPRKILVPCTLLEGETVRDLNP